MPYDRDLPELGRVGDLLQQVPHLQPLLRGLDEAAGPRRRGLEEAQRRNDLGVAGRADDLVESDALFAQVLRVDLNLELLVTHAPDRDVRHSRHAHQARPHHPPRDHRLLDRRRRLSEASPIIMTLFDEDSGASSVGGFDTLGSACAWVSRSSTSWRAR